MKIEIAAIAGVTTSPDIIYWINDNNEKIRSFYVGPIGLYATFEYSNETAHEIDYEGERVASAATLEELKQKVPYLFL